MLDLQLIHLECNHIIGVVVGTKKARGHRRERGQNGSGLQNVVGGVYIQSRATKAVVLHPRSSSREGTSAYHAWIAIVALSRLFTAIPS